MADVHDRLVRCFSSVFPLLDDEGIRAAELASLADADSLSGVTLAAVIDEEFGVDFDLDALLRFGTFQAIHDYLRDLAPSGATTRDERAQ